MKHTNIAMKLSPLLLMIGLLFSTSGMACNIRAGNYGFRADDVLELGDMKVKIIEEHYGPASAPKGPEYYVVLDVKAMPKYLKRGIKLKMYETFTDTICGNEVMIKKDDSGLTITSF